jgi:cell division septum initiation protein DivIVA
MHEQIPAPPEPDDRSLPAIRDPDFKLVRRGYDSATVDVYVASLRQRIAELEAMGQANTAVSRALAQVGDEVVGILQEAHNTGTGVIEQARNQASEMVAAANREADDVTQRAENRVRELDEDTEEILAERERIINDARELARQLLELAQAASDRFPPALEQGTYVDGS